MLQLAGILDSPHTADGGILHLTLDSLKELGASLVPGYELTIKDTENSGSSAQGMASKIDKWKQIFGDKT